MPVITPTPEQQAAIEAFIFGGDLVLEAGAGTGKTSTLRLLANRAESKGLYLAYNKAIATEAGSSFPPHVPARTAHSLAYRAVGADYRNRLNGDRLPLGRVASFLGIDQMYVEGVKRLSTSALARLSMEMVGRFCQSADDTIGVHHRPYVEGIENHDQLGEALLPFAAKAWRDLIKPDGMDGRLMFSHDHYLKIWQLSGPTLPCDFVLFDEAQDANPCIADVVSKHQGQRIYVGDRAQSIYGWRGAVDAMDIPDVPRLFLSQSFRFGQPIADEANYWLDQLDTPLRLTGNPEIDSNVEPTHNWAGDGDARAVLCRTNGTAFETFVSAQDRGIRAHLQGGGQEIISFARGVDELRDRGSSSHRDLTAFQSWGDVQDYVEEAGSAAGDLKTLVKLVDKYDTYRLTDACRKMYPDEETAQLTVSTAHKAKGREWDSVRIAPDFEQRRDLDGQLIDLSREEIMLRYVAVTRAQYALDRGPLAKQ